MLQGADLRVELLGAARGRRAFRGQPWSSSASFAVVRAFSAEVVLSLSAHAVSAAAVNHTRIGRSSTRSGRSSQESKNQSIDKERVSQILARCSEEAPAPRRPSVQRKSELTRCITETGYQPHHVGTTDHYDVKARGRGDGRVRVGRTQNRTDVLANLEFGFLVGDP